MENYINYFKVKLFSLCDVTNLYLVTACSSQPLIHVHSCTHTSTFIFHLSNHKNISTRFHSARNEDNKLSTIRHVLVTLSDRFKLCSKACNFWHGCWLQNVSCHQKWVANIKIIWSIIVSPIFKCRQHVKSITNSGLLWNRNRRCVSGCAYKYQGSHWNYYVKFIRQIKS